MNNKIYEYLDYLFPNPKCELNYKKDYELLIAVMLSAQTTDKRVNEVTSVLFKKYPTLEDLNKAPYEDVLKIIKPLGSFQKKTSYLKDIAKSLCDNNYSKVPNDRKYLENLKGVGRKTANVFLSEIYNVPAIAVDTHVERVSKRLKLAYKNDSVQKVESKLMKKIPKDKWIKIHHQFVLFGRYHCKAINPNCNNCLIKEYCIKK